MEEKYSQQTETELDIINSEKKNGIRSHGRSARHGIEDTEWFRIRPTIASTRRKHSIKGKQSYSKFNKEFYFPKNSSDEFEKMILPWILVSVMAIIVAIAALLIDYGVIATTYTVYGISQTLILDQFRNDVIDIQYAVSAFLAFAIVCVTFAFLAGCLVLYVSPLAEGSGISDVKSYLNGVHIKGLFSVPALVAKALGCCFSIGSGLVAGREGPIIHIGALLGSALSQWSSDTFQVRLPSAFAKHFRSAEWKRDFAVMGSACGVAAAFAAPMGGVLFAIEEGATVWRQQLTFLSLYSACITTFLVSIVKGYVNDNGNSAIIPYVLLGSYRNEAPSIIFRLYDFPFVLLIAVCGGVVGALFSFLQKYLIKFRFCYIRTSRFKTLSEIILISLMISSFRFWVPYAGGKCISDVNMYKTQFGDDDISRVPNAIPFNCQDTQTNDLGLLFWVPIENMLKYLLHEQDDTIASNHLIYALLFYFSFMTIVYGLAVPLGLFIPSFVVGGCYGRLVGKLASTVTGNPKLISSYTLLGSTSALGGMTRVTISVALIALESTQNINLSLYVYMVVIIAKLIADSFNLGYTDVNIVQKDIPFLVDNVSYAGYQLTMGDVLSPIADSNSTSPNEEGDRMRTIVCKPSLRMVLKILSTNPSSPEFIVTSMSGGLEGSIERLVLLRLLQCRLFGENAKLLHPTLLDSAWPNLRNEISIISESALATKLASEYDVDIFILNLIPYIDKDISIVLPSSSVRKAHDHLRSGERYVFVADPKSIRIIGTVQRHDIMPGPLGAVLVEKIHEEKTLQHSDYYFPLSSHDIEQLRQSSLPVIQEDYTKKEKAGWKLWVMQQI